MNWPVETLLTVHVAVVAAALSLAAVALRRRGLFHWTSAGFWAWASFALYFVLNPFFALHSGDLTLYSVHLTIAGGTERGIWILLVGLAGMGVFFWAYLRTRPAQVQWRLSGDDLSLPMMLCAALFAAFGVYSLLTQRALVVDPGREAVIEGGRFTGEVTGYDNAGYMFLVVPMLMLVLSRSRPAQVLGWASAGLFVLLALPNGWSRFALVSVLLAISLADAVHRKAARPRWLFLPVLIAFTVALQVRGHTEWALADVGDELLNLSQESFQNVDSALGSTDASMLATWYLESYVTERYGRYSFGLPMVNYAITGWIPNRLLPDKYFLIDWLSSRQAPMGQVEESMLYGAKSSLLGSFYDEGGWVGVIFLAGVAGFLSRKLDGMITLEAPLLVRATGVAWMSVLWMIWGSSDTWGLMTMGVVGLPALFLWLAAPKHPRMAVPVRRALEGRHP